MCEREIEVVCMKERPYLCEREAKRETTCERETEREAMCVREKEVWKERERN